MSGYRIKQPLRWMENAEAGAGVLGGLVCMASGNVWAAAAGCALSGFCLWILWRDWRRHVCETVFSDGTAVRIVRRSGVESIPLSQFCGVATASFTERGTIGNHYYTALVPARPDAAPLVVHEYIQSFARKPAVPPAEVGEVRRRIAGISGLPDFGDVGAAGCVSLYAACRRPNRQSAAGRLK